jgi:hypothetical protein
MKSMTKQQKDPGTIIHPANYPHGSPKSIKTSQLKVGNGDQIGNKNPSKNSSRMMKPPQSPSTYQHSQSDANSFTAPIHANLKGITKIQGNKLSAHHTRNNTIGFPKFTKKQYVGKGGNVEQTPDFSPFKKLPVEITKKIRTKNYSRKQNQNIVTENKEWPETEEVNFKIYRNSAKFKVEKLDGQAIDSEELIEKI